MLVRTLLFAALIGVVIADDYRPSEIIYRNMDPCRQGGCLSPVFDKGYFFQTTDHGYALWDREGQLRYQVDIVLPDGTPAHVRQAAIDTDGSAVLPISYGDRPLPEGHVGGGIALINPDGKQTWFIDTELWIPRLVCVAADHAIWVAGTQYDGKRNVEPVEDYQLIRKYSRDGKLIGAFLPRSLFPVGLPPSEAGWMGAANDRVGVMTYPGMVANEPEWVELDFDGRTMGRWKLGPAFIADRNTHKEIFSLGQLALTADARLFALPYDAVSKQRQIMIFDRSKSSWQPSNAAGSPPPHAYLVGADGNNLAFESRSNGVHIIWVPLLQGH